MSALAWKRERTGIWRLHHPKHGSVVRVTRKAHGGWRAHAVTGSTYNALSLEAAKEWGLAWLAYVEEQGLLWRPGPPCGEGS